MSHQHSYHGHLPGTNPAISTSAQLPWCATSPSSPDFLKLNLNLNKMSSKSIDTSPATGKGTRIQLFT